MRNLLLIGILFVAVLGVSVVDAKAQFGVGIKVPSTTVFVANKLDSNTLFELGVSLTAISNATIQMAAAGKIYFAELNSQLILQPFIGAGVGITFINSGLFFSPFALAGLEAPIPNAPLSAFLELGLGLTFNSFGIGVIPGAEFGLRVNF